MEHDEIEFLISQHFDGTLDARESSALLQRVNGDASVRKLFNEYAAVDTALKTTKTKLVVDEDWLADAIGEHIDEAVSRPRRMHRFRLVAPLAIAACALIGLTLGVVLLRDAGPSADVIAVRPATPVMEIALVAPAVQREPSVAVITVGTPTNLTPQVMTALHLARDDFGPSRVLLAAAGPRSADVFD